LVGPVEGGGPLKRDLVYIVYNGPKTGMEGGGSGSGNVYQLKERKVLYVLRGCNEEKVSGVLTRVGL